jgi:hypothetical protein
MGLPRNGDSYPLDAFALLVTISPEQSGDDPTLWYVTCQYDTDFPRPQAQESQGINPTTGDSEPTDQGVNPATRPDNPLDRPPVYKVGHEQTTEVVTHDFQQNPILNCADEPYDPPLEDEVSYAVVNISKNLAVVKFDWLEQFVDSVNSTTWNGREPRTCRMIAIEYEPAVENGVSFWRVSFRVKIKPQTWDRIVLEQGYKEKKDIGGGVFERSVMHVTAGSGINSEKPILLDGLRVGSVLDAATRIVDIGSVTKDGTTGRGQRLADGAAPVYTRWRVKPEKSFNLLGL